MLSVHSFFFFFNTIKTSPRDVFPKNMAKKIAPEKSINLGGECKRRQGAVVIGVRFFGFYDFYVTYLDESRCIRGPSFLRLQREMLLTFFLYTGRCDFQGGWIIEMGLKSLFEEMREFVDFDFTSFYLYDFFHRWLKLSLFFIKNSRCNK